MANAFRTIVQDPKFRHIRCIFAIPDMDTLSIFKGVFDGGEVARKLTCQQQSELPERRWKGKPHRERRVRDDREIETANFGHL